MTPRNSGQRKYLASNSAATSFTATAGRSASMALSSGLWLIGGDATQRVVPLDGYRGIELEFFGAGSNDTTANYRVYGIELGVAAAADLPLRREDTHETDIDLVCVIADTSTVTLSTATGVASGLLTASDVRCDTVTATLSTTATTPRGPGTVHELAYQLGAMQAYSPANNVVGRLTIPYMGNFWGFLVDFDMTGATSMNCLYKLVA